jgi:hypothetical protein
MSRFTHYTRLQDDTENNLHTSVNQVGNAIEFCGTTFDKQPFTVRAEFTKKGLEVTMPCVYTSGYVQNLQSVKNTLEETVAQLNAKLDPNNNLKPQLRLGELKALLQSLPRNKELEEFKLVAPCNSWGATCFETEYSSSYSAGTYTIVPWELSIQIETRLYGKKQTVAEALEVVERCYKYVLVENKDGYQYFTGDGTPVWWASHNPEIGIGCLDRHKELSFPVVDLETLGINAYRPFTYDSIDDKEHNQYCG